MDVADSSGALAAQGPVAASMAIGRLDVALALGGLKALIVGFEFMELRHAAVVHLAGDAAFVVVVVLALEWMIRA